MIRVGIIGAAGYTGGELIRLLLGHQDATLVWAVSESQAGKPIHSAHNDLLGDLDMSFVSEPDSDADVVFLCMGHGRSKAYLDQHMFPSETKIIDLSHDFRLGRSGDHGFVYGLPEVYRDQIASAQKIANPGCFATAIQLGLLPLAASGKLPAEVHIQAITGSTGAGQALSETTHFTWRDNNVSVYKPFRHQHEAEILETLDWVGTSPTPKLRFIPVRGNFTRGIFATMYVPYAGTTKEAKQMYEAFYQDHPFVHTTNTAIDLKQVVNTNKCLVGLEVIDDNLLIISMIDNLIKGASGQAVQNMNIQFGIPETTGLLLKPSAF